jgi:hypothetical protein
MAIHESVILSGAATSRSEVSAESKDQFVAAMQQAEPMAAISQLQLLLYK